MVSALRRFDVPSVYHPLWSSPSRPTISTNTGQLSLRATGNSARQTVRASVQRFQVLVERQTARLSLHFGRQGPHLDGKPGI
jgi:hypothetical protein